MQHSRLALLRRVCSGHLLAASQLRINRAAVCSHSRSRGAALGVDMRKRAAVSLACPTRPSDQRSPCITCQHRVALVSAAGILSALSCRCLDQLGELLGEAGGDALADLQQLWALAEGYGFKDWLVFDASVVRGLAYYTGGCFACTSICLVPHINGWIVECWVGLEFGFGEGVAFMIWLHRQRTFKAHSNAGFTRKARLRAVRLSAYRQTAVATFGM